MRIITSILILIFASLSNLTLAQNQHKIYSLFILNFARTIQWPAERSNTDFVIGVFDYPGLAEELRHIAEVKTIGNQKIVVRECSSISEADKSHIVFIPASKSNLLAQIAERSEIVSTLIITEKEGLAKKGSGINFLVVDGKQRFEINSNAIEKRGMKVPTAIKSLGIPID